MLGLSLAALAVLCAVLRIPMADLLVYRAEGAAVAHGRPLYGFAVTAWHLPATYPPFAALLFLPTAFVPLSVLKAVFCVANVALLALLVLLSCRFARIGARPAHVLAATALGLWLEPVFQTLIFGQVNLALVCLVLWDVSRPEGAFGKGFAVGLAAGIKITPLFFVLHLLVRGRVREALTALAGFGATVVVGALVLPYDTVEFFTRRLFETGRVGKAWIVDNQSLQGALARLLHTPEPGVVWVAAAIVVGAAGLWTARRDADERRALLVSAFTALLISPISWSHHWVWCVPLIAVVVAEGRTDGALAGRTRAAVVLAVVFAVVFTARTLWLVPHAGDRDLQLPLWQQPLASPYPLVGLAVLGWAARRATRRAAPAELDTDAQLPARSSSASMIR
ncbi:glycosyltransferase 87 family protein [Streptomyces sp. NPDC006530]|uniref:glycosyltransferase 87 family protein n=1 Tax=Streptomyces sp. NPDC006530 TaxID=3364750 RepID=UPI0036A1BDC3